MEVGVQSGGKLALLRDYIGPGLEYVGIDINPDTERFEGAEWVHIEIGDSENPEFWKSITEKYPHVDIFLDDGGHTMKQQMTTLRYMLAHVQPEGVFIMEDLATSWARSFGGIPDRNCRHADFLNKTAFGLIHQTLDWFHAGFHATDGMSWTLPGEDYSDESWWKTIPQQIKHIHFYNQIVVYEKGLTYKPEDRRTVGSNIPYLPRADGKKTLISVDPVMSKTPELHQLLMDMVIDRILPTEPPYLSARDPCIFWSVWG